MKVWSAGGIIPKYQEKILSPLHFFHHTDWPGIELGREERSMPSLMVV